MSTIDPTVHVSVCVSCRRALMQPSDAPPDPGAEAPFERPGPALAAELTRRFAGTPHILVTEVECLAVCKRPCTIALSADAKWTYLIGDLDTLAHAADIEAGVRAYAASDNGIVAWKERPTCFRKGVVARVPPLPASLNEAAE